MSNHLMREIVDPRFLFQTLLSYVILIIFTLVFVMCGVGRCIASAAVAVANGLQNTFLTADDFPFVLLVNPLV